jgi:hypothetical protein
MYVRLNTGMKMSVLTKLWMVLAVALFLDIPLWASPVRISFLRDSESLQDTLKFLKSNGCGTDAIGAFQKAVERYNMTDLKLDFGKFPPAQNGFYSFQSSTQLLAVIPHRLNEMPHPFEFNCFDTTILLSDGQFRTGLHPDDLTGGFLAKGITQDGQIVYSDAATAREVFNLSYPTWYQDASNGYIPSSMADTRICLTAALYGFHMLPASTNEKDVSNQVMSALRAAWKSQAITFPARFQIVLCHQVDLVRHSFATTHSGLLFPAANDYVYIEKAGGSGPFVRLDFSDKADLKAWLAWKFEDLEMPQGSHVFVTFNDNKIESLNVGVNYVAQTPPNTAPSPTATAP